MTLNSVGDLGFLLAAVGLVVFAFTYLTTVRWWTDALGLAIAAFVSTVGLIVALASVVVMGVPLPGIQWWRAFLYPILALTTWSGLIGFVWSQFLAPRRRVRSERRKTSTRRDGP